ncbi:AAA family ATPase [Novosphingobium sp. ERN07]|uniref:AAA family ATPase n=1 Tax=Novosphingobium sp. ERN07 TaxID=2726187 RepID=UPI001456D9C9|nr:ATP-binding protein [Novosphingobium sp. ERN07]NLR73495.1 AAA family ATPase [Novosphingobium sp. ERN07]
MLSGADELDLQSSPPTPSRTPRKLSSATAAREGFGDLVEIISPERSARDIIIGKESRFTLLGLANEVRHGDDIRRHGLRVRSKVLFCGPPGCGKSLCAEVVAAELKMPLVVARLDALIASHLGETATNLRKIFDAARTRPMVLFFDEFDALARARNDTTEHSEIRRVVNSLLMMIDRFDGRSILIAATNLEETIDRAILRRFDEVILFNKPSVAQIRRLLYMKTRNFPADFDIAQYASDFTGMSYAQVERACLNAIRSAILLKRNAIPEHCFKSALDHEISRAEVEREILD